MNILKLENRRTGELLQIRRARDAQGQVVFLIPHGALPAGADGPPLHVHFRENEEIVVKAGTLGALVGTEKIIVPAGGTAVLPAGIPHRWWNAGDGLLEVSGHAGPAADLDRYLQALFAVLNDNPDAAPSIFYLAHVLWRHRDTQQILKPPPAVQGILFPVILFIGRILGKYRGSNWPGSPESCPGAQFADAAGAAAQ